MTVSGRKTDTLPLTRVHISLSRLDHNMSLLEEIARGRPLWPAIKADAYGHGAAVIADRLVKTGFSTLCVAHVAEAIVLEESGIQARFIILSPDLGDTAPVVAERGYEPVVCSIKQMEALSRAADTRNKMIRIHLKMETGMGRVGFEPENAEEVLKRTIELPGIEAASVMTHFPRADEADRKYSIEQTKRFRKLIKPLKLLGVNCFHMANSAAIFSLPEAHLDLCRPGISIYGLAPSTEKLHPRMAELKPVLSWRTRITQLKAVAPETGLSYGHTFITTGPSLIATVPVGYGDGLSRSLSGRMDFLIRGRRCPQVGRICMDQCMIDVTSLRGEVEQGDEAVIIGKQGSGEITADELALTLGTINYEIVTQITRRVPRIAIEER